MAQINLHVQLMSGRVLAKIQASPEMTGSSLKQKVMEQLDKGKFVEALMRSDNKQIERDMTVEELDLVEGDVLLAILGSIVFEKGFNYPHCDLECIKNVETWDDAVAIFEQHKEADMFVYKLPGTETGNTGPPSALWLKKAGALKNRYPDPDCCGGFRPDRGDEAFKKHVEMVAESGECP